MKRPLFVCAAILAVLSVALPAAAANGRSVKGQIASISRHRISITSPNSIVTSCAVLPASPSLEGYAPGDAVQAVCHSRRGHLFLFRIRHLTRPAPATTKNDSETTTFGGAISALSDDSITVRDGDRQLTCSLDSSSPSTDDYRVGQHVKVGCAGGELVAIAPVTSADAGRYYVGTVSALDDKSITLQTEHGPATCTIGPGSPSTAALHVGDRIGMGCNASTMQLVLLRKVDGTGSTTPTSPTEPTAHTKTGARGTLSAVTETSVSVTTDGGVVTCTRGASSPSLGDATVGDHVEMGCLDGVLTAFAKVS